MAAAGSSTAAGKAKVVAGPSVEEACNLLVKNEDSLVFQIATEAIFKILQNLLQNPTEEKYRTLRRSNPAFAEKIGKAKGGVRFLKAVGFVEDGAGDAAVLVLPADVDTDHLRKSKAMLKEIAKQRMDEEAKKREAIRVVDTRLTRVQCPVHELTHALCVLQVADNAAAAVKLADLEAISKQNQAKQTEVEKEERARLLKGIEIDREDRERQKDPMQWK